MLSMCAFFGPFLLAFIGGLYCGSSLYVRFQPQLFTLGCIGVISTALSFAALLVVKVNSHWIVAQVAANGSPISELWFTTPLALTTLPCLIALGMTLRMSNERARR